MSLKRESEKILKSCEKQGFTVELRRNSCHYKITSPTGEIYFTGSTPSDSRSLKNMTSYLRRMGAKL